ncbi:MAG TPA: DEAD/DEAH box helicase family protein [Kiritimatiellia bacterium]|nr:DEAD/DEAH box helicase family protein [Kiritimatiellia bacterium]
MYALKEYQQRSLKALETYFNECVRLKDADTAFYESTRRAYVPVRELPGLPYVCLRLPTGGGKTLVACHAVGTALKRFIQADHAVVLWLTPSNAIREQTLKTLKNRQHPYRQAVESEVGSLSVLDIEDARYVTRSTLDTDTTIIVSTMQAFRVTETEGRKVYEDSGHLMDHFTGLPDEVMSSIERRPDGTFDHSLANVLRTRRPIVIVDEAHNSRTDLSFETLARFNPSCIIEFTATPAREEHPSNVLHTVSAAELKAEAMIKMPIQLETRPRWKELLADAIAQRNGLEKVARAELAATSEYIRPIMLLQAQPNRKGHDNITVDVLEESLLQDHNIPKEQIARATGADRDLDGVDILSDKCEVRYVITIEALREGWDCPFAYVLCTVAETRSGRAAEQILGRVLRLPKAAWKKNKELNTAYAFAATASFAEAANGLTDALIENGFEKQEAKDLIVHAHPVQDQLPIEDLELFAGANAVALPEPLPEAKLPEETRRKIMVSTKTGAVSVCETLTEQDVKNLRAVLSTEKGKAAVDAIYKVSKRLAPKRRVSFAEQGELFSIPVLALRDGDLFEQFEETHFREIEWNLSKCDPVLPEADFPSVREKGHLGEIDITDGGQLKAKEFVDSLQIQIAAIEAESGWTVAQLVNWLDKKIPHPDVSLTDAGIYIAGVVRYLIEQRQLPLDFLARDKYRLRSAIEKKIDEHRQDAHKSAFQLFLQPDLAKRLVVTPEQCFTFDPNAYPYNQLYHGSYQFQKHYYPQVGDLEDRGEEFECAQFIDALTEVKCWVRNLERRPRHSFWIQTSTDKFYPDFVCVLNDKRYLVIEYKGEHLWSNDDSKEKRLLGDLWAERSDGKCLFVMPKGKSFADIKARILQP